MNLIYSVHQTEAVTRRCSAKGCFEKFRKIDRKTLVLESHFNKVVGCRPATS